MEKIKTSKSKFKITLSPPLYALSFFEHETLNAVQN